MSEQDEIIDMARQSGMVYREFQDEFANANTDGVDLTTMIAFAKLVAARTMANIDPSSFMSYQEGFEAGNRLAIDGIIKQLRQLHDSYSCASAPVALRTKK
jgi:hypothetical protein